MEYLYHYTNLYNMRKILESGALKLTPSNLLEPKDCHVGLDQFGEPSMVSETDSYKPVVWLTNSDSKDRHGITDVRVNPPGKPAELIKGRVRFVLEKKPHYEWWHTWSDKNRMSKSYKKRLIFNQNYASWYVSETEIPLSDILYVEDLETGEIYFDNRK